MSEPARLYAVASAQVDTEDGRTLLLPHEQAYVTETATGLTFRSDTPIEVWGSLVERLQRQQKVIEWALADAINFGERYGEDHAQWVEETGLSKRTLQNIARIGRLVEPARRRANVSFSHHAEVATLAPAEQESLLDRAESAGMTRYDLRDAVRERRAALAGKAVDAAGDEVETADLIWAPSRSDLSEEAGRALASRLAGVGKRHSVGYEAGFIACLVWLQQEDCFKEWRD